MYLPWTFCALAAPSVAIFLVWTDAHTRLHAKKDGESHCKQSMTKHAHTQSYTVVLDIPIWA